MSLSAQDLEDEPHGTKPELHFQNTSHHVSKAEGSGARRKMATQLERVSASSPQQKKTVDREHVTQFTEVPR